MDIQEYLKSLPNYITILDITNQTLITLPDLSRFDNLKILWCNNNQIRDKHLIEMTSITDLDLEGRNGWITDDSIKKMTQLRSLNLEGASVISPFSISLSFFL